MSLITPTNGDAAVIIGNRRCDHEFVIIAPVLPKFTSRSTSHSTVLFSVCYTIVFMSLSQSLSATEIKEYCIVLY